MGRKPGSLNRRNVEITGALNALEKDGSVEPKKLILHVYKTAIDPTKDPHVQLAAARLFLAYRFGLPRASLDLSSTLELGESWVQVLTRVIQSPERRAANEELDRWREQRRRLNAVTVEAEAASP